MDTPSVRVGMWSALAVAAFTIWFMIAFALYSPALLRWQGIEQFAQAFDSAAYVAWVVPCLFLALSFPVLGVSILLLAGGSQKIWAALGLLFAAMYGAVLSTDYWLLLTVVRDSITARNLNGLEWLIVGSPHSITNTIEGIGYGFMGLSAIFQSFCFGGTRLGKWIKGLLLTNGMATVLSVVTAVFGLTAVSWIVLAVWGITFPAAMILLAFHFGGRLRRAAQ